MNITKRIQLPMKSSVKAPQNSGDTPVNKVAADSDERQLFVKKSRSLKEHMGALFHSSGKAGAEPKGKVVNAPKVKKAKMPFFSAKHSLPGKNSSSDIEATPNVTSPPAESRLPENAESKDALVKTSTQVTSRSIPGGTETTTVTVTETEEWIPVHKSTDTTALDTHQQFGQQEPIHGAQNSDSSSMLSLIGNSAQHQSVKPKTKCIPERPDAKPKPQKTALPKKKRHEPYNEGGVERSHYSKSKEPKNASGYSHFDVYTKSSPNASTTQKLTDMPHCVKKSPVRHPGYKGTAKIGRPAEQGERKAKNCYKKRETDSLSTSSSVKTFDDVLNTEGCHRTSPPGSPLTAFALRRVRNDAADATGKRSNARGWNSSKAELQPGKHNAYYSKRSAALENTHNESRRFRQSLTPSEIRRQNKSGHGEKSDEETLSMVSITKAKQQLEMEKKELQRSRNALRLDMEKVQKLSKQYDQERTKIHQKTFLDFPQPLRPLTMFERIGCGCRLPTHRRQQCPICLAVPFDDCPLLP